ncbi:LysR substrate-binding domain-containing protein [Paramicrobacterium agarici]|uniref:LysR substrate binding domain-containing protein n=1 Tax=Paramicrobacterium agarici TaxID=630514 RepID=A0A2A9DSY5_9MICO|nr:LysR substrate-binding domain-containing protein [Microbacterium agarici]PFG29265.1 LysR substrate binding domain-containing protein [Microbacterium agarici]
MADTMTDADGSSRLRIAFVPGVSPDKWFRIWRERESNAELVPVPLEDSREQRAVIVEGRADMVLARLPIDTTGLHVIPLYAESPVVVAPKGHVVEAADAVELADLTNEHLLQHPGAVPEWREVAPDAVVGPGLDALTPRQLIELVATGAGIAILPLSVARQFDRKDVVRRPVLGVAETRVALCWREGHDDELTESFIGVVRGRSAHSTRARGAVEAQQHAAQKRAAEKKNAARRSAEEMRERKHAARVARRKAGGGKRGRR